MAENPPLRVVEPRESTVDALVAELRPLLDDLRAAHGALAETDDPGGPLELKLERLLTRRRELTSRLGEELARWVAAGYALRLEPPASAPAAGPAEEEASDEGAPPAPAEPPHLRTVPASNDPDSEPGAEPRLLEAPETSSPAVEPPRALVAPERSEPGEAAPAERPSPCTTPARTELAAPTSAPRVRRKGRSLRATLDLLGPPGRVSSEAQAADAVRRLVDVSSDLDEWLEHPTEVQRALVGLTSSVARHVQDECGELDRTSLRALGAWFSTMTRWSGLYKPGFVRGLSRANRPERGTWLADAQMWWEQLTERLTLDEIGRAARFDVMSAVFAESGLAPAPERRPAAPAPGRHPSVAPASSAMSTPEPPEPASEGEALRELEAALADPTLDLEPALHAVIEAGVGQRDPRLVGLLADHRERVAAVRGLKTLKSALKFARAPAATRSRAGEAAEPSPGVPEDWPFLALTRGVHAVVVGGDPRPTDRMRDGFAFGSVTWDPIDPRRVDALAARIRALSVEFVILLRDFVSHSVADAVVAACKDANVPYVVVDAGYGVGQVRLAIERYLQHRLP